MLPGNFTIVDCYICKKNILESHTFISTYALIIILYNAYLLWFHSFSAFFLHETSFTLIIYMLANDIVEVVILKLIVLM